MATKSDKNDTKITSKEMKDAIRKSGYLLEQRVEPIIAKAGYYVNSNSAFLDPDTGKTREIDIKALTFVSLDNKSKSFLFPVLLCECENNSQPIVFFTRESQISFMHHENVKLSGIPVKIFGKAGYERFSAFSKMDKFHHYREGLVATQYCTFQMKKDKSAWLALHSDEQHDTFNSLIKAVEYEITSHYRSWIMPDKPEDEPINLQIYYPLIVLQGDMYSASLVNNRIALKKSKHVQFIKEFYLPRTHEAETYQIDVITEDYLEKYLGIIESEADRIKSVIREKNKQVVSSVEMIIKDVMKHELEPDSYRKYFEL